MKKKLFYYNAHFVGEVSQKAMAFLLARDAYLKAWRDFYDTPIGLSFTPCEEAKIIKSIMEDIVDGEE